MFTAGSDSLTSFVFGEPTGLVANLDGTGADLVYTRTLDGQTITYNTTDSLIRARNDMVKQLIGQANALKPARRNKQTQLYQAGRGYY